MDLSVITAGSVILVLAAAWVSFALGIAVGEERGARQEAMRWRHHARENIRMLSNGLFYHVECVVYDTGKFGGGHSGDIPVAAVSGVVTGAVGGAAP